MEDPKTVGEAVSFSSSPFPCPGGPAQELTFEYESLRKAFLRQTEALASAAHELKTPLSVMQGYLDLLVSQKLGPLTKRQVEVLAEMKTSGVRLSHFIREFLSYAKLETGQVQVQPEDGDLNASVAEIASTWAVRFQSAGIAFYYRSSDEVPNFLFDTFKIQHVVSNLLENAMKYTPRGGTVWMSVEPHHWERRKQMRENIEEERRRRKQTGIPSARICVADTGLGIAPEHHLEIFDAFVRVRDVEDAAGSVGLGLHIARQLIQAHGGKIWVESEAGYGSKFYFLIPIRQKLENDSN